MTKRAYVMEAYIPHGGTWMAYNLGRILHQDFGYSITVLTDSNSPDHNRFDYSPVFQTLPIDTIDHVARPDDVLICNPSFSAHNFGLRVNCKKVMYIQDFKTFQVLDGFFDHYVSVSPFVRKFIADIYDIHTDIIAPFIDVPAGLERPAWQDRPPLSLALNIKGDGDQQALILRSLRRAIAARDLQLEAAFDWDALWEAAVQPRSHTELLKHIGAQRYLLSLSVAEGFGLVPLEAMAMGTAVAGFDGFGGRMYMDNNRNCAVSSYPRVDALAQRFIKLVRDEGFARKLVKHGAATAERFTYAAFHKAWKDKFRAILG